MILSAAIKKQCHAVVVVLATTTLLLLLALGCSSTNAFVPVVVVPSRPQPRLASNNWVGGKPTYYHLEQQLQECRIPFAR